MTVKRTSLALFGAAILFTAACTETAPPQPKHVYPAAESPGALLLQDRCGKCHGAPLPMAHPGDEWPGVVDRMQNHMLHAGMPLLDETQRKTLLDYLGEYGRKQ